MVLRGQLENGDLGIKGFGDLAPVERTRNPEIPKSRSRNPSAPSRQLPLPRLEALGVDRQEGDVAVEVDPDFDVEAAT